MRLRAEPTPAVGWVPASHLAVVEADEPAGQQAAAVSSTDPDVMREYLAMLSSSEDFSAEDLRAVCEEEGVVFGAGDSTDILAKLLQDHLIAQLAAVTRNEYAEMIEHMSLEDAVEVCEEEGIDAH